MIKISIENLNKHFLTPDEILFLYLLTTEFQLSSSINLSIRDNFLIDNRLIIKSSDNKISITKYGLELLKDFEIIEGEKILMADELMEFCQEYRNLFPSGVTSGGRLVKGDKAGVYRKMKKFILNHPGVSFESILNVTRSYISKFEGNYSFLTCADYLIEKDGLSQLSGLVEQGQVNVTTSIEERRL
jgi:hypothetical protein